MTTLEQDLDRLRERLRLATAGDLRRRARRRRRVLQLALVPALALAAGGVAVAVAPVLNEPAPPPVQKNFDDLHTVVPEQARPWLPEGTKLSLWARDGDLAFYGASSPSGTWCGVFARGDVTQGAGCVRDRERPAAGEIRFDSAGGATHREGNFTHGQVGAPDAVTVEIGAAGVSDVAKVPVGHNGWFIAQLPDSTLVTPEAGARPPDLSAVARDAAGAIVARGTTVP